MPQKPLTVEQMQEAVDLLNAHEGDMTAAADASPFNYNTFTSRIRRARETLPASAFEYESSPRKGGKALSAERIADSWNAYADAGYNLTEGAVLAGLHRSTFGHHITAARAAGYEEPPLGQVEARTPRPLPLPEPGEVKRYILTAAQNNTRVHKPTWKSLQALAEHYDATLMVSTFMYVHRTQGAAKRGTNKNESQNRAWYDAAVEPYINDGYLQLAPGLIWCGHMNISPTKVSPLSGFENYTGRNSGIFPHTKVAMTSIATIKSDPAKFNWTTGCVTLRNYIQRTAGLKGEFHHVYGALLVEVDSDGHWFVRHLSSDRRGWIYDLRNVAKPSGEVTEHSGIEAIVWGDIHEDVIDPVMKELAWGEGGMIDELRPKHQVMHDLLDFSRRSHHTRRDPHARFKYFVKNKENIKDEMLSAAEFLRYSQRKFCKTHVARSNHDEHLERWLKEVDWRNDLPNAEFYLAAQQAFLKAIREDKPFNVLEWAVNTFAKVPRIHWLQRDESYVLCKKSGGGIEVSLHGDLGPNGSRGSVRNLSKLGRKVCIGHSHSAGIVDGAWQAGVTGSLHMDYATGPSSWSATHILVYPNGKRSMVTAFAGKWRADLPKNQQKVD